MQFRLTRLGSVGCAIALLATACSVDQPDDSASTTTTAVVDTTTSSTTVLEPDEPFIERKTTLTSSTVISNDRPIRILIGTECAQQSGTISVSLSTIGFRMFQRHLDALDRQELRVWVPTVAPPGDYRLAVECSYTDVVQPLLTVTLTKSEAAEPQPTAPDSVTVENRKLTVIGTGELFNDLVYIIQLTITEPDSIRRTISVNMDLGLDIATRAEINVELPSYLSDGPYEALISSPNRTNPKPIVRLPFDLTTPEAED